MLAIDAMGGDSGPHAVIDGIALAVRQGVKGRFLPFGDAATLTPIVEQAGVSAICEVRHAEKVVQMTDKPSHVIRRGRDTSMWHAMSAVKSGEAQAIVSSGNTGALMAMGRLQLRMIDGVDRPAISALWPTLRGKSIILDVGANVEADEKQLVQFAIMGEAFFRALNGTQKPTVGLLNVGAEDLKGDELIRKAAKILREADPDMAFTGFVEGDDISKGAVDVVVTDGFTGNVAIKTAEGAARLLGQWVKDALSGTINARIGSLFMMPGLRKLKARMNPSSANGGVFLGLNGIVVKSHGGADAQGFASAAVMAANLANKPFLDEVRDTVKSVTDRQAAMRASEPDQPTFEKAAS